jgi:hypothetical protein
MTGDTFDSRLPSGRRSSPQKSINTDCEMDMTEADLDKAHAAAFDAIQNRVRARVNQKCFVVFSGYKRDQDNVPIDNLDDVPISGSIKIRASRERLASGNPKKDYESEVFENPTWLDLCAIANAHLVQRAHRRELYLESASVVCTEGDVKIVEICMRP